MSAAEASSSAPVRSLRELVLKRLQLVASIATSATRQASREAGPRRAIDATRALADLLCTRDPTYTCRGYYRGPERCLLPLTLHYMLPAFTRLRDVICAQASPLLALHFLSVRLPLGCLQGAGLGVGQRL